MYKIIPLSVILVGVVLANNIEPTENGSFCITKPPKRAISANCSSTEMCEILLNVSPAPSSSSILDCGDHGECVTNLTPNNEYCKDACESSSCASLCLQLYETKSAQYCIDTRDHPNAMTPGYYRQNKYYCTCLINSSYF